MKARQILFFFLLVALSATAQTTVTLSGTPRQRAFPRTVPAGNYSGMTAVGEGLYAVVDDKAPQLGFHLLRIEIDSVKGRLLHVAHERFVGTGEPNQDEEGIAYYPARNTLWIGSEAVSAVREYRLDGVPTGRSLPTADIYPSLSASEGLESLTYSDTQHFFWTCNEGSPVIISAFGDDLRHVRSFAYELDAPQRKKAARNYAHGVSELLALDDGSLLVLEREFFVPKQRVGAWVACKIYQVFPSVNVSFSLDRPLAKHLVAQWKTRLNLTRRSLANYEGMCLGPRLADGRQSILLVADSQAQYAGILKDYFKVILLDKND